MRTLPDGSVNWSPAPSRTKRSGSLTLAAASLSVDPENDSTDSDTEMSPKMVRRFLELMDSDESDDDGGTDTMGDNISGGAGTARSSVGDGGSTVTWTRTSSLQHSERSHSTSVDERSYSLQETRYMEQMRLLRKFIRDRNYLIAGQQSRDSEVGPDQLVAPDGGWGWVVVAAASLVFFFSGGLSRCFTLIYLQFLDVFNQSAAATSATAAIFGAVKMCTSPIVSMLCQRFSKRAVAVCGGVLTGLAMVLTSYPLSLEYLYISYGIMAAFGINMVLTPCFVVLGEYFKKKRARAMSLAMLGGSAGGMALPPLLNYLFDCYGYSGAMLIYSGLMLNICLAGTLFRPVKLLTRAEVEKKKAEKRRKKAAKLSLVSDCEEGGDLMNGSANFDDHETHERSSLDSKPPSYTEDDDKEIGLHSQHKPRGSMECIINGKLKDDDDKDPVKSHSKLSLHSDHSDSGQGEAEDDFSESTTHVKFQTPDGGEREDDAQSGGGKEDQYPVRRRRVSFQMATMTQLIPGIKFDDDDEEDEGRGSQSSSESRDMKDENSLRERCRRKFRSFLWSFGFHLFKKPRFLFYSLLMMASILSLSISGTFLSGLVSDLNMDKTHTSIMLSASAILDVPSKFASGFIFDLKKIRPYRSLPLAGLGFVTGAFALGIGFSRDYTQLFIVFMIYNFFASAYHTQHATVLADLVGAENLSMAMGLCRLCQGIGFCLGPTIGGHLKDTTGRYQNAYVFSGAVLLTATILYTSVDQWFMWRKRRIERAAYFPKGHYARYRSDSIAVT